ncbi:MAG: RNA methyltransferase [Rikenellaceae bacterium]|nr:RNA methyltransferase [Rikenellaceae bacterium]
MKKKLTEELNRISIEEYKIMPKNKIIIVADNIRSLNNIGSMFRTSDAFGVEAIYLCGISATPPNKEIHKTALGAELSVEWKYFKNTEDAVNSLKENGYTICVVEQVKNSVPLNEMLPEKTKKYAFIFGNEVNGVSQEVINMSDLALEIPQIGTKHSLNVSVTTGIVIWEFFKKYK